MTRLSALTGPGFAGAPVARTPSGGTAPLSEADARRLREAADALEALFVTQLVKASNMVSAGLARDGAGGSVYQGLAEESFGDALAKSADFGIAKELVRSFEKHGASAHERAGAAAPPKTRPIAPPASPALPASHRAVVRAGTASAPRAESAAASAVSPASPAAPAKPASMQRAATGAPAVAASAHPFAARLAPFADAVREAADRFEVDPRVIEAVIARESSGNPRAESPKGARGLMQIIPATARELGLANAFDPRQNILAGTRYLSRMLERFNGDLALALAAYNAGPGAVARHGGIPPYRETIRYVSEVLTLVGDLRGAAHEAASKGSPGILKESEE